MSSNAKIEGNLIAQPVKLADLAVYQTHSIVSREIIRKAAGTVTVFAFDAGEGLSEHTAPFDAMVYALEGRGEIMISDKRHAVGEGDMIIMPANRPHAVKAVERFKMLLILVK
jgi:quercetin dioxygenase-like cupin family protein